MKLSAYLDSMNLPEDKKVLKTLIRVSLDSFAGKIKYKRRGKYLFAAENSSSGKVVGCSAIFAQHGTPEKPHLFFQLHEETKQSRFLGKTFHRKYLTLEKKKDGPTEMGALVVLPQYRRREEQLGLQLAFVRYLYIWNHRDRFKRRFLAELNGVFRKDGGNDLWDAMGARFTGLDYRTADRLSAFSKEFILASYPNTRIYVDLIPKKAQKVLGRCGPESKGAQHLLELEGFRYLKQCCPFDGGPHYGANWNDLVLFDEMFRAQIAETPGLYAEHDGLISFEMDNKFFALRTCYGYQDGRLHLPKKTIQQIKKQFNIKTGVQKVRASVLELPV